LLACLLVFVGGLTKAQTAATEEGAALRIEPTLLAPARGDAGRALPIIVRARTLRGRPDIDTQAEGDVELRRGGATIRADTLNYDVADDLAVARGGVRFSRDGNSFSGTELQLRLQRAEGFFLNPTYFFARAGAGGSAQRIDFLDEQRAVASGATYTSCTADGTGTPAWLLSTRRVKLDFEANEGIAEQAVLRFYGVPILALPALSFPLTDERKSGWLPPSINLDSKSGLQFSVPYYWNIAPHRDATLTPAVSLKRGVGGEAEFRYLEARYSGSVDVNALPHDRITGHSRYAAALRHDAELPWDSTLQLRSLRVSDDEYWKDFPRAVTSLTPRLLSSELQLNRGTGHWQTYARVQGWQVLQTLDTSTRIEAPYERLPQIGARYGAAVGKGFELAFETEFNRFANPANGISAARPTGLRVHAVGQLSRAFGSPGWTLTPRLSFNAASYALDQPLADGRRTATRVIPTFSLDSNWALERDANWFGRDVRQTLEPRLLYVKTPYRSQATLPNFDAAGRDFNFDSIFTDNAFSGVDRVSDSHQVTAGLTSRLLNPQTGAESLRVGLVQRYLLSDQRVTPDDGPTLTQRFSDVLLLGSTNVVPKWNLDAALQYSPDSNRVVRSVAGARYSPGPFRTVGATYRLTRGTGGAVESELVDLGWQWPLSGLTPPERLAAAPKLDTGACAGSWYSVGRINYSTRDRRITDSVVGVEYDAGCWIGRVVAERLSTGRSEATTRLSVQLELVGLSRLNVGANPLQVLKDNIPGFRMLREERTTTSPPP
jgi:LPS-assembly protein